jgi:flagellar motility protein MotE (MotC chaperone)
MKNLLVMGFLASTLFAISAGLSLWLQSSKTIETSLESKEKEKEAAKKKKDEAAHDAEAHEKPKASAKPPEKSDPKPLALTPPAPTNDAVAQRSRQMELALQDLRTEREAWEKLSRQVIVEAKAVQSRADDVDAKTLDANKIQEANAKAVADLKKTQLEIEANEKKNLDRIATLSDSMPADTAAKVLQQLADGGKMDTAVKVLAQMKERQAARVLAEMPDPALAAQLIDKMRTLKKPAPTP